MVAVSLFLLYKLYQFAGARNYYPAGLDVAGIDVGGMTKEQASEILTNRYLEAPITLFHGDESFEVSPTRAEFTPDIEAMLSEADYQRTQQDFWAGFWGFLWGRPVDVEPVALQATHNREALRETIREIASLADQPAQPPQPVPSTLSFQYGTAGTATNVEGSLPDVEAALYRPSSRQARLSVEPRDPERPDINLLTRLLVNRLQVFEQETGGVASTFIMDLDSGGVVPINEDVAMSGIDLVRIPIAVEAYRTLDQFPTLTQRRLISDTLVLNPEPNSANRLLTVIAGEDDMYKGAEQVTTLMQRLGLTNTFIAAPYDAPLKVGTQPPETPANSVEELRSRPDPEIQTTAEDMGLLLSMIYYCAEGSGGALVAAYPDEITPEECQQILDFMSQNEIGSLIEAGLPADTPIAHRHGWISDTHGDAAIVTSPGGNYVIVTMLYKPDWLEWELSAPLIEEISRATYNYFNFDNPYFGEPSTG
ncbi:MAG: serine hydrolase [Candidatus Promineifilaceae bacterium]